MTMRSSIGLAGLAVALAAGGTHAQTTTAPDAPAATAPGTPGVIAPQTPPGGVARGVIRPEQPVDSGMVAPPPTQGQAMPVIKPPGTAR